MSFTRASPALVMCAEKRGGAVGVLRLDRLQYCLVFIVRAILLCVAHDLLLILAAAMERLVFDGAAAVHPASLPGMRERTIVVGSASKELRMIGWIVAPESVMPESRQSLPAYVDELQARRDTLIAELDGCPSGFRAGGWSLLLQTQPFGIDGAEMPKRLLTQGVAATAMAGWGEMHGRSFIRFVFANEPVTRLQGIGRKVRRALGIV
jgi:N-succinyldiaminopimelate aminotransferase